MFNFSNNQYNNQYSNRNDNSNAANFDTLQKAREDLIGEIHAIIEYDNHIHTTTDELARQTWIDIKDEEITHVGELLGLLNYLDPTQKKLVQSGFSEFMERMKKY